VLCQQRALSFEPTYFSPPRSRDQVVPFSIGDKFSFNQASEFAYGQGTVAMGDAAALLEQLKTDLLGIDIHLGRLADALTARAYFDLKRLRVAKEEHLRKVDGIQDADIEQIKIWQDSQITRKCVVTLVCSSNGLDGPKAKHQEEEVDFSGPPSYQVLISKVEMAFNHRFADEAYVLKQGKLIVDEASWLVMDKVKPVTIAVSVLLRRCFGTFCSPQRTDCVP
jgi:hypothetical protein